VYYKKEFGCHLKKRPTEFQVDKVLQPFEETKFNFTKVGKDESLFQFEASDDGEVQFFPNAPIDVDNTLLVAFHGVCNARNKNDALFC
jgi:hypothetical protein